MAKMAELDTIDKSDKTRQWDEYFNGKPWTFYEGSDYTVPQLLFIHRIRYQGRKRGLRVKLIQRNHDSFTITAYKPENTS